MPIRPFVRCDTKRSGERYLRLKPVLERKIREAQDGNSLREQAKWLLIPEAVTYLRAGWNSPRWREDRAKRQTYSRTDRDAETIGKHVMDIECSPWRVQLAVFKKYAERGSNQEQDNQSSKPLMKRWKKCEYGIC